MAQSKYTLPLVAGAGLLGAGVMFTRRGNASSSGPDAAQQLPGNASSKPRPDVDQATQQRKEQKDAKRDLLPGAGVGGNAVTGGPELGAGLKSGNTQNPDRAKQPKTDKSSAPSGSPTSDSPSSGTGPGITRGMSNQSSSQSNPGKGLTGGSGGSGSSSWSETLQGAFGTGGASSRDSGPEKDPKDTRIASNHAATPTNRGGSPFDKHRKDVTAVSGTSEYPGKEGKEGKD